MPALEALGIGAFLEELAFLAARRDGAGGLACAITLHLDGQPPTVAASDGLAAGLAEAQAADGDGPGFSVAWTGEAASIAGLRTRGREPDSRPAPPLRASGRSYRHR
jgi:hypothetical protein